MFYEILVGRRAFERDNEKKVIDAILREIPPIATELDRNIPMVISQIVHKMLAKKPDRRFAEMPEVIETLKKASRREPIEYFNPDNFEQSIQSARAAFQRRNYELASEILYTIEAEGYVDAEALRMRHEAIAAIQSSRVVRDLKHAHELVDDGNYVLASEKVASVLVMEPANIDALALEKEVRKKLEGQNIASLKRVARLHLENRNFDRARESLERVLRLNETDSEALQTLNEVDRRDLEFRRLVDKQQELYQSARQAWQQGEVTSALGKIERVLNLDSDLQSPDPDQRSSYERFFQEVRARADSLRAARAEVQRSIERRDFARAREVCDGILTDDPNNAAFQALKVDIEDRHQRALLETIAEVDAKLGSEPRLDERLRVLEAAAARFPGEPHFERHLQAARRKQDTVNRLVDKARLLEDQHRYGEALSLWEIVETTYAAFPGLAVELARVRELVQDQRRAERRSELTLDVERYLDFSDFDKADAAVRDGRIELPDDPALDELAQRVAERRHNSEEAALLMQQGRAARESRDWAGGVVALRRAYELRPKDREVRAEYLFTLAQMARAEAALDPGGARLLVKEGLQVEAGHASLRAVAQQLDFQLKDSSLKRFLERAKQALAEGDVAAAMEAVEEAACIAPEHAGVEQMQRAINAEFTRRSDLETLHRIEGTLQQPVSSHELAATNLAVVKQIGARSGSDQRIAVLSDDLSQKLAGLITRFEPPPVPPPTDPRITRMDLTPVELDRTMIEVAPVNNEPARAVETSQRQAPQPVEGPRVRWSRPLVAAGIVVALLGGGVLLRNRFKLAPNQYELAVQVAPDGADVSIDGVPAGPAPLKKFLAAGEHRIKARRPGFKDTAATVNVGPDSRQLSLALEPEGIPVHFVSDYRGLTVKLDGKPFVDEAFKAMAEGTLSAGNANHSIEVGSGSISARVGLSVKADKLELQGAPLATQTKLALLIRPASGAAPQWLLPADAEVLVDGASVTKNSKVPVAAGPHQIRLANLESAFEMGTQPELWVFLSSGKLSGHLRITANVPEASIFLDGERNHLLAPATIPSVRVRNLRLRVEKAGYEPYSAIVPLKANETTSVNATLRKVP